VAVKGGTNTFGELLFAQNGAGNALAGNASAGTAALLSKQSSTYPLPRYAAANFQAAGATGGGGKAFRYMARGVVSTAASSVQSLLVGLYTASSDTASAGTALATAGGTGASSGTLPASLSNAIWELELDVNVTAEGTSATWQALGLFSVAAVGSGAALSSAVVGAGGSATVTLSTEADVWFQCVATWSSTVGSASASNTLTCYQTFLFAYN
jgi:hypothetical protein